MVETTYKVISDNGIHARVASQLVREAAEFDCDIFLVLGETKVDLKSIMGVMSLGVYKDEIIRIICSGNDEEEAIKQIEFFLFDLKIARVY